MPDISIPIIEQIIHPSIWQLRREVIPATYVGSGDLTRVSGPVTVDAYGLAWSFFTVPSGLGYQFGSPNVYDLRMIQLTSIHRGTDAHEFISEVYNARSEGMYWQWSNAFPVRIHFEILPYVVVQFYWLLV